MNLFDLTGKNAFVIGSGGIGSAIAEGLSWQGANVVVADISEKNARSAAEKMRLRIPRRSEIAPSTGPRSATTAVAMLVA